MSNDTSTVNKTVASLNLRKVGKLTIPTLQFGDGTPKPKAEKVVGQVGPIRSAILTTLVGKEKAKECGFYVEKAPKVKTEKASEPKTGEVFTKEQIKAMRDQLNAAENLMNAQEGNASAA